MPLARPLRSLSILAVLSIPSFAPVDSKLYSALKWRNIGPFRGGRISAVSGSVTQPGVFYTAAALGGVWKTVSAGTTWFNVTDSVPEIANNETHQSTTDPDARLARKSGGHESKLAYCGNVRLRIGMESWLTQHCCNVVGWPSGMQPSWLRNAWRGWRASRWPPIKGTVPRTL
jgi:hypothetical protein